MSKTDEDLIWNRACLSPSEQFDLPGDQALSDMLSLHGLIMNGGIHHAFEVLSKNEVASGIMGFRYFRLKAVADFLSSIRDDPNKSEWTEANELAVDRGYFELIRDDDALVDAFSTLYRERPDDFGTCS